MSEHRVRHIDTHNILHTAFDNSAEVVLKMTKHQFPMIDLPFEGEQLKKVRSLFYYMGPSKFFMTE